MLLKSLHKAPAGVFIKGSVLEELLSDHMAVDQTGRGDKFHIDLDTLSRVVHLLIRLGDIFGVWRMDGHDALSFEETVKTGNGAGVTALDKLHPEDDQPCIRIASAHIRDELDLLRGMLVRMMMRASGTVPEGLNRAIKALFPSVDVLSVGLIFDGSVGDTVLFSILDKG